MLLTVANSYETIRYVYMDMSSVYHDSNRSNKRQNCNANLEGSSTCRFDQSRVVLKNLFF